MEPSALDEKTKIPGATYTKFTEPYLKKLFNCNCCCYILTLDRAVNQRCTCVNKRKKKQKEASVMKEYRLVPAAVELVGDRKARVKARLQTEGCGPQRTQVGQPQPRCGRSAKWVLEDNTACYGQEKKLGQYSRLSLSPLISHTLQKHQPFRE